MKSCATCRYADLPPEKDDQGEPANRICKRYPPVPLIAPVYGTDGKIIQEHGIQNFFPLVASNQWCGEWEMQMALPKDWDKADIGNLPQ